MSPERPKIDYVSPLPPVRSGIADYSLDLLPHLAELAEVRVVRLPGQEVAEEVVADWAPVEAADWLEEDHGDRLPLYQMGNNQYHREVERLAMRRPGALTLHDLVLHHYLLGRTVGEDDYRAYERRLVTDHGWIGEAAAKPFAWRAFGDAAQFSLPANRRLLRRQRGVLVHNAWAREMILMDEPDLTVHAVRMGMPPVERAADEAGRAFRVRWGIPEAAFVLGSFGFQTPMKRPRPAMQALLEPGLEDVHLLIAGEAAETTGLERMMFELDLASRVHITGFLDFDDFEAAIAASDLALNLRYPSAGETSASLLRVLSLGRAAIISDYAQFAELPDDVGVKVPVGDGELEALAAAVRELAADRDRLQELADGARRYVAHEHRLEDATAEVVAACADIAGRELPAKRPVSLPPPTSTTWHSPTETPQPETAQSKTPQSKTPQSETPQSKTSQRRRRL